MLREIGSEFWFSENYTGISNHAIGLGKEVSYLFTGRTAIDYVLSDIPKPIEKVYMPSYCCDSMLKPFLDRSIDMDFYDVLPNRDCLSYSIDIDKSCDLFFASSYFGFSCTAMDSYIETFKDRGIIVLEDISHRLFSDKAFCEKADYSVASIRKWLAIPSGGIAVKHEGAFIRQHLVDSNWLAATKLIAMKQKAEFISRNGNDLISRDNVKETFLLSFRTFENILENNYRLLSIDDYSRNILFTTDYGTIREKRRNNASCLYDMIKSNEHMELLITNPELSSDCPLFVPVRIKSGIRDKIKDFLISKNIYCPTHWNMPNGINISKDAQKIYEEELSLVCDQRYSSSDMERIYHTLEEFWACNN